MTGPERGSEPTVEEGSSTGPWTAPPPQRNRFPGVGGSVALIGVLFFLNIVASLVIVVGVEGAGVESMPAAALAAGYVFAFAGTLAFGVLMSRSSFSEVLRLKSFPPGVLVPLISVFFGLWVLLIQMLAFVTRAIPIDQSMMEELSRIIFDSLWIGIFLLVIAAPVLEEALFRGLILRGLLDRYNPARAVALSALFFAFAHFNIWQFPASFSIGLFLGWIYYRTRSLPLCILLHSFHNLVLAFLGQYVADLLGISADVTTVPFLPWWVVLIGVIFLIMGIRMTERRLAGSAPPQYPALDVSDADEGQE